MPCAAHNIQSVIKDGLKFNVDYIHLIEKVSKNIVTKSKCVTAIAEKFDVVELNPFHDSVSFEIISQ
jgi:hypothetical protein